MLSVANFGKIAISQKKFSEKNIKKFSEVAKIWKYCTPLAIP